MPYTWTRYEPITISTDTTSTEWWRPNVVQRITVPRHADFWDEGERQEIFTKLYKQYRNGYRKKNEDKNGQLLFDFMCE